LEAAKCFRVGLAGFHRLWRGRRLSAFYVFGAAIRAQHARCSRYWLVTTHHGRDCCALVSSKTQRRLLAMRGVGHNACLGFYGDAICGCFGALQLAHCRRFLAARYAQRFVWLHRRRTFNAVFGRRAGHLLGVGVVLADHGAHDLAEFTLQPRRHPPQQLVGICLRCRFLYVAGFFAWYRGLALGGAVRVSQVQLVQPFLSLLFAIPLLGEKVDAMTLGFGLAVIATVFVGKKMPVGETRKL
jgi:EamA-like transporter family